MVKKTEKPKAVKVTKNVAKARKEKKTASERKQRQLSRRFHKLKVTKDSGRAVLYVGHLPKGFNEAELKQFFQQFGQVTKLRVSRSVKTARSRGYAFLEFAERKVAETAAKAMDQYMIFGRLLDVHVMDADKVHKDTFQHGNRDWKFRPTKQMFRSAKNSEAETKTDASRKARVGGLLQKEKEKRDRLKELEIDYAFGGYQAAVDAHVAKQGTTKPEKKAKKSKKA